MTSWPELPYGAWRETRETLHRWAQVLGKIQLARTPLGNHWWNVALRVTPRGIATSSMPSDERSFDLELDFASDVLRIRISDGTEELVPLPDQSVADLHREILGRLRAHGIPCTIRPVPSEVTDLTPLDRDTRRAYDRAYVIAFWDVLRRTAEIMDETRVAFVGKCSPPQLYWGHLDLTMTRFSGRVAALGTGDRIEREAYSHELASVGFWAGDERMERAAFYGYAYPEPPGFATLDLGVVGVGYDRTLKGFYLDYDVVRGTRDPHAEIQHFFDAVFAAAAELGRWDRASLERPREEEPWRLVST